MLNVRPEERFFNPSFPETTSDAVSVAQHRVHQAIVQVSQMLEDQGVVKDLAVMFQADPLAAETAFRDEVCGMGRTLIGKAIETFQDFGSSLEIEGKRYRKVEPSIGQALTLFGPVAFNRSRYRPSTGRGECFIPAEHVLGLLDGDLTPAAASLSMMLLSSLTVRESADIWERICGEGPSVSTLCRLTVDVGRCMEECSDQMMAALRAQEELPQNAAMLHASLDGVMMRMNERKQGDNVIEQGGWREASSGIVSVLDPEGNMLDRKYFGRLPEAGKQGLKSQIRDQAFHWLKQNPDLKLVVSADGAKDNWTFAESMNPDEQVTDFWHATEYLKDASDAAFRPDEQASTKWFEQKRHMLRHDPKGADKVIDALRYLRSKSNGCSEVQKALGYFRNNRQRMDYHRLAEEGYPIGSGEVEAANKLLVVQRLKRSGQSWGRDGGQGVLSQRALLKSGRFDRAWRMLVSKLNRSNKNWEPVMYAANDNRLMGIAA